MNARPDGLSAVDPASDTVADWLEHEDAVDFGEGPGALAAHEHGPGIVRDTVRCPACTATIRPTARA